MSDHEWLPLDSRKKTPSSIAASFDKRFLAGFLDLIIALSFIGVIRITIAHVQPDNPDFIFYSTSGAFLFYYFIWALYKTGKTQGKRLLSLKVVYQYHPDRLSLSTVLFRELILKLISILSFGVLFWKFYSDDDDISFQDHYSDTRVVIDEPSSNENANYPQSGLISSLMWIIPTFLIYIAILLATPTPLYRIKIDLNSYGINALEMTGYALKGFQIKELQGTYKNSFITLHNLTFNVDIRELILHQKIVINNLNVSKATITEKSVNKDFKIESASTKEIIASAVLQENLKIKEINFSEFAIHEKHGKNLKIQNLKKQSDKILSIENFFVETNSFIVNADDILVNLETLQTQINSSNITIRSRAHPRLLRDFSFNLSAEFNLDKPELANFTLTTSDEKFRLHQTERSFIAHLNNFDPRPYVKMPWPINSISLEFYDNNRFTHHLQNPNVLLLQTAEIQLHGRKFSLTKRKTVEDSLISPQNPSNTCEVSLCLNYPDRSFSMNFNIQLLFDRTTDRIDRTLKIEETTRKYSYNSAKDFLAQIYFNRNYSRLNPNEKNSVDQHGYLFQFNLSKVADTNYLNEIKLLNHRLLSKAQALQTGTQILESMKKERTALNIYKGIAFLKSMNDCASVLALPSHIFTDLLIQEPNLNAQINTTLGTCYKDPKVALKFFDAAALSTPQDAEVTYLRAETHFKLGNHKIALNLLKYYFQIKQHSSLAYDNHALNLQNRINAKLKNQKIPEAKRSISSDKKKRR